MKFSSRLLGGSALSIVALLAVAVPALAQSTGTQEVEKVIVTGERQGIGGTITKEKRPKTRSTITQTHIKTQQAGQSFMQSLNIVPGLNFTNNDPYGASGGNVRLRGFDGNRVSLTQDGIPLNDTGNYAIFTNQLVDPEYIERATVNTGTTDVDSPTASATGGTINTVTRTPYEDMTFSAGAAFGAFNYQRFIGILDFGEYRGVSAFGGLSFQEYEKFKGPGELQKTQTNARIYQKVGEDSFVSVIGHYNENRNNFYRNLTKAQINQFGDSYDNFATCTRDTANGVAGVDALLDNIQNDGLSTLAGGADNILNPASCTNFYSLRINPSNTGNIRAQANLALTDDVRLTIDPSWQYVKANGGGTTVVSETDRRLVPAGVAGTFVDLNGDGDGLDSIRTYSPSNTNTSRYGATTSLIWDIDDASRLRVAYTGDHGRHRQTGAFGRIFADGTPTEIFGGLDSATAKIVGLDGSFLRSRDRLSHAILNQVALSYSGIFLDDRLVIDAGVRAPFFSRDLNQYCYTQVSAANTVRCTNEPFSDPDNDGIGTLAGGGTNRFIRPYSAKFEYEAVLPNVGASYEFIENNLVYVSYAEGFSAPRTDNLYYAAIVRTALDAVGAAGTDANVVGDEIDNFVFPGVEPEKTKAYDLGYRYQGDFVTASAALWYNQYENRIVSSVDQDLGVTVDRNIGKVTLKGLDVEVGVRPADGLTLYASASYIESELESGIAGLEALTRGKELVETPDWTWAARINYEFNDFITAGIQSKYVGNRFSNDGNTEIAPSYLVTDANLIIDLKGVGLPSTLLQINGSNIFNETYLASISSPTGANFIPVPTGNASFSIGAPQTFQAQIRTQF